VRRNTREFPETGPNFGPLVSGTHYPGKIFAGKKFGGYPAGETRAGVYGQITGWAQKKDTGPGEYIQRSPGGNPIGKRGGDHTNRE